MLTSVAATRHTHPVAATASGNPQNHPTKEHSQP